MINNEINNCLVNKKKKNEAKIREVSYAFCCSSLAKRTAQMLANISLSSILPL